MDKAGIAFIALILVLISLVMSILAIDTGVEKAPLDKAAIPAALPRDPRI